MFKKSYYGKPIPPKVWAKATDILAEYCRIGEKWVKAGRPFNGSLYGQYCAIEKEYNAMADATFFAKRTTEQREDWSRISKNH